jgi:hypothetical protein
MVAPAVHAIDRGSIALCERASLPASPHGRSRRRNHGALRGTHGQLSARGAASAVQRPRCVAAAAQAVDSGDAPAAQRPQKQAAGGRFQGLPWLPWHKPCRFKRQVHVGPVGPCAALAPSLQPRAWYLGPASLLPHLHSSLPRKANRPRLAVLRSARLQVPTRYPSTSSSIYHHSIFTTTHTHHSTTPKMRFSTSAVFAAVAIGAQALPQEALPITQIPDGQIQVSFTPVLGACTQC